MRFLIILLLASLLATVSTLAQSPMQPPINISKGQLVVLKIPGKLVGFERISWWDGEFSYGTIVERSEAGVIRVNGLADWQLKGWPLMRQLTFEKVSREKNFTLIELKDPLFNVKLRFDHAVKDLNSAFRDVAFLGLLSDFESSEYYQKEVVGKVLPSLFTDGSASLATARKLSLLKELKYIDSAIKNERYKGSSYLSINLGGDSYIYNSIRADQTSRIGDSLNQRVLFYFKRIARIIKLHPGLDGIKISIFVPYKNFVTEAYLQPSYDRIEIYAAMDVIQQFVEDELTNQEFVDESVLLINGNRAAVPVIKSL